MTGKQYLLSVVENMIAGYPDDTLRLDFSDIEDCQDLANLDDVTWPGDLKTIEFYDGRLNVLGKPPHLPEIPWPEGISIICLY